MRLAKLMALRPVVGAGLLVTLTDRCPLSCAHCSVSATRAGRHLDAAALLRFLRTFTADRRPEVLMLTGGEPLLRPSLVADAARAAREAGTRTAVLSGAFFAAAPALPAAVRRAARAVDHFSLSLDAFHEREIPRSDVLRALEGLLALGVATSLHVLAAGPRDTYPDEVAEQVRRRFGDAVPLLVSEVRRVGRGAALPGHPARPPLPLAGSAAPCAMAAWPVVASDGTLTACCEQRAVDGPRRPGHLVLGNIRETGWPETVERTAQRPLLRAVRVLGPVETAANSGAPAGPDACGTCHQLGARPEAAAWAGRAMGGLVGDLLQSTAVRRLTDAGPAALVARHGSPRHAHLVGSEPGAGPR
ncbi:radical SAM protein [Streptomyces sp. NPDC050560]|uniref:radical SAM protein n=1 Tax=Streptomyces sp. NPDC050560 TaxID=3365630 RepID=UPI0037A5AD11